MGPVTGEPGTAGPIPRVAIAEDSVLLLAGLTKLLESAGFEVAATAGEAGQLREPDVGRLEHGQHRRVPPVREAPALACPPQRR